MYGVFIQLEGKWVVRGFIMMNLLFLGYQTRVKEQNRNNYFDINESMVPIQSTFFDASCLLHILIVFLVYLFFCFS